jgi:hypothetical protein
VMALKQGSRTTGVTTPKLVAWYDAHRGAR